MVFDGIMKDPNVLADFVFVYGLQLRELHLIKDMIHPTRRPKDARLEVHKSLCYWSASIYSVIVHRTGKEKSFFLRFAITIIIVAVL